MFLKIFQRMFGRKPPSPRFPGIRIGILAIEGEETLFEALRKELAKDGIIACDHKEPCDFQFSYWTVESHPGLPIVWGMRLMLSTTQGGDIGDYFTQLPFYEVRKFASFVAEWIVDCLLRYKAGSGNEENQNQGAERVGLR